MTTTLKWPAVAAPCLALGGVRTTPRRHVSQPAFSKILPEVSKDNSVARIAGEEGTARSVNKFTLQSAATEEASGKMGLPRNWGRVVVFPNAVYCWGR